MLAKFGQIIVWHPSVPALGNPGSGADLIFYILMPEKAEPIEVPADLVLAEHFNMAGKKLQKWDREKIQQRLSETQETFRISANSIRRLFPSYVSGSLNEALNNSVSINLIFCLNRMYLAREAKMPQVERQ